MHIEIQVALNFVISYLYNKLPRRRVNIFGEELEKALKHKFQGHWYLEKPFKGSAFRCLKTGEPMDAVLEIAARESGVPIADILENLPAELSVWIDPGEVSYRIGEKGAVKILYSEQKHDSQEDNSADREVTTTFNPEAQCFRPIEIIGASLTQLTLSPKASPNDASPTSSVSPMYPNQKNGSQSTNSPPQASSGSGSGSGSGSSSGSKFHRQQEPVLFTTATFAQTKFGSTKLKNNSKRTNRMSPTEFSNYIKQRQMQQHHNYHHQPHPSGAMYGAIGSVGSVSPTRSISPNPMALQMTPNDMQSPFVFPNGFGLGGYPQPFGSPRNIFDSGMGGNQYNQYNGGSNNDPLLYTPGKCSSFMDPPQQNFCKMPNQQANGPSSMQNVAAGSNSNGPSSSNSNNSASSNSGATNNQDKLLDGMNTFYNNNSNPSYQHLLVAN